MNKNNSGLLSLALFMVIIIITFGCSNDKLFKPGLLYKCDDGKSFIVEVFEKVDMAILKIEERRYFLPRVPSSSGTKYSEGNVTFWVEGDKASVEIGGRTEFKNCLVTTK
jgi:membrane-bound inhibitor of C-type lysozyme